MQRIGNRNGEAIAGKDIPAQRIGDETGEPKRKITTESENDTPKKRFKSASELGLRL